MRAPRLRPRHHPLRPRQQLRPAARLGRGELRPTSCATDLAAHRDELIISTKAGYLMWPGPYGEWGSRKYLLASLDQSLRRMGLDYVDIFYSHRFDPDTPLEETMGALDYAVRAGQGALRRHLLLLGRADTAEAAAILREPRHALPDPPAVLLDAQPLGRGRPARRRSSGEGIGCIAFSPLAQGMLTDKYLGGIPEGSRARRGGVAAPEFLNERQPRHGPRARTRSPSDRGQTLAQMALAWVLRDPRRHLGPDRRQQRRPARGLRRRRSKAPPSPPRSWPRSTATPRTPASTCGAGRGRRERGPDDGEHVTAGTARGGRHARHGAALGLGAAGGGGHTEPARRGPPRGDDARREDRPAHYGDGRAARSPGRCWRAD